MLHTLTLMLVIAVDPGPNSLHTAQNQVREALAKNPKQHITVSLADGVYPLTKPLSFGKADSPEDPFAVTWAAGAGATPVISGGRELRNPDGWDFAVPEGVQARGLYVNDKPSVHARHPNSGYLRVEQVGPDRRTSFRFREGDLPQGDFAGAELLFLHDWSSSSIAIAGVNHETRELRTTHPVGSSAKHYAMDNFEKQPRYAISGVRACFDAPGEWLQSDNTLHYRPREGESPGSVVTIPIASQLIVANDAANLRFHGITFAHTAYPLPEGGHAGNQAAWFEDRGGLPVSRLMPVASALDFTRARNCELRDCELRNLGGSGVIFGVGSRGNRILRCEFRNIDANAIGIGDKHGTDAASDNVIDQCLIEDCGRRFLGAVGIWVGIASGTRITHCELRNLPYTGISLGWRWWSPHAQPHPIPSAMGGSYIADNHIHHVMQTLSDGGGIYTLGVQPGTVICRNRIHHIPVNLGRAESNGMFFDQGSGQLLVEENIVFAIERSPFRFHKGWHCELRNNRVALSPGSKLVTYNDTKQSRILLEGNQVVSEDQLSR